MTTTKSEPPVKPGGPIFISHAGADDAFVRQLREALEIRRCVWSEFLGCVRDQPGFLRFRGA